MQLRWLPKKLGTPIAKVTILPESSLFLSALKEIIVKEVRDAAWVSERVWVLDFERAEKTENLNSCEDGDDNDNNEYKDDKAENEDDDVDGCEDKGDG